MRTKTEGPVLVGGYTLQRRKVMEFGISAVESLILLALFLGIPLAIVFLLVRAGMRYSTSSKTEEEGRRLAAELDAAQLRIEELERKIKRVEDQTRFTESLLEGRGRNQPPL